MCRALIGESEFERLEHCANEVEIIGLFLTGLFS